MRKSALGSLCEPISSSQSEHEPSTVAATTPGLMTYQMLRERTGIPLPTLYSLVSRKKIPCFRLSGRIVRFSPKEIDAWIESARV
jgi:excisionase family DNA binding protein